MDFVSLEVLFMAIVQHRELEAKIAAGDTDFIPWRNDNMTTIQRRLAQFRAELAGIERKHGKTFPQYRELVQSIQKRKWSDALEILKDFGVVHPDADDPVEVRISNR